MINRCQALGFCFIFGVHILIGGARYADYNKRVAIEHPFADQYEILVRPDQLYLEQADGTMINIPTKRKPSEQRPASASMLPSISSKTSASTPPLFAKLPSTDRSSMLSDITTLPSDRSTDLSSITLQETTSINQESTMTSTLQETEIKTQSSLSDRLVSAKLSSEDESIFKTKTESKLSKKFPRPSTASSKSLYEIASNPELWLTNNKQSTIQVTVFLKTRLKTAVYDPTNADSYKSSSKKVIIPPGEQIKVQVPLNCYLDSMQVAYNPVGQPMQVKTDIFQNRTKFTLPKIGKNNLMVGAKPYAHSIVISDRTVQIEQISATKAQTLLNLRFEEV